MLLEMEREEQRVSQAAKRAEEDELRRWRRDQVEAGRHEAEQRHRAEQNAVLQDNRENVDFSRLTRKNAKLAAVEDAAEAVAQGVANAAWEERVLQERGLHDSRILGERCDDTRAHREVLRRQDAMRKDEEARLRELAIAQERAFEKRKVYAEIARKKHDLDLARAAMRRPLAR